MSGQPDQSKGTMERLLAVGKDLFALLRDGSLFLLALLLLAFPKFLNDVLTSAGFEEGSVVGFKWKARLVETDDALKTANATVESLQAQLKQANDTLAAATAAVPSGELRSQILAVEKSGRRLAEATVNASDVARSTIAENAPLVQRAKGIVSSTGAQAVVMGSDRTLSAAEDEVRRATKAGITNVSVYFRNGYYATLSIVDSRDRATEYLQIARTFRPDAYIARIGSWCKSPVPREGYTECSSTK
jgi:hypothetical protein